MGNICDVCSKDGILSTPLNTLSKSKKSNSQVSSESQVLKKIAKYDLLKVIGTGSFGKVYLCRDKTTGRLYALKMLQKKKIQEAGITKDRILIERKVLSESDHPRIVKFYSSFQDDHYLYFLMEYLQGGSMKKYVHSSQSKRDSRVKFYACQILEGLMYLHRSRDIIYRDLKPENILLDADGNVQLCDFGLAIKGDYGMTFCGTPEYIAPEIIERKSDKTTSTPKAWICGPSAAFCTSSQHKSFRFNAKASRLRGSISAK